MTYALAVRETETAWRVFCNHCRVDVGTMLGETLRQALIATVNRGGVMCPGCRAQCCRVCGIFLNRDFVPGGFCWFCDEEGKEGMVVKVGDAVLSS